MVESSYATFKLWYALSVANNQFSQQTDSDLKIENTNTPAGEEIKLLYVIPSPFRKRQTDVSNAIAVDPTAPDTGTGASDVIIRFAQKRETGHTAPVLPKLLKMFYKLSSDDTFKKGRFGLESTDNPALDCLPIATAGYKFIGFKQEPNQNQNAVQIWELTLKFVGDNTQLGTKAP